MRSEAHEGSDILASPDISSEFYALPTFKPDNNIAAQLDYIDTLLQHESLHWEMIEKDTALLAFITNQCETNLAINNLALREVLNQTRANLLRLRTQPSLHNRRKKKKYKYQVEFEQTIGSGVSTTCFSADTFQDYFQQGFRYFYGCVVPGDINLSQSARASKKSRTISEIHLPATDSVNLCNTILKAGKSSKGKIGKIIFNAKTDFRKYDFSCAELEDALFTYIDENNAEITLSAKVFIQCMEAEYYRLRGGREKNLKNDFFKLLENKTDSEKCIAILKHVQALKNRFNFGRSRRTLDAFHHVTKRLILAEKERAASCSSIQQEAENAFQNLTHQFQNDAVEARLKAKERQFFTESDIQVAQAYQEKQDITDAEFEKIELQRKLAAPTPHVYQQFKFFDFLDQRGELCADKIISQPAIFRNAVLQIKETIIERRHALFTTAEKILFGALSAPGITADNQNKILANCIFLDALSKNAPRLHATEILENHFESLDRIVYAYYFMNTADPAVAGHYKEQAKNNIDRYLSLNEVDKKTVKASYLFLKSIDAPSATTYVDIAKKLILENIANKDRVVFAFQFLKLADEESTHVFALEQKNVLAHFSDFYHFLGTDPKNDEVSRARRDNNKKRLVFAYQFLKAIGEIETIKAYDENLRHTLFQRTLDYSVLKSCRECDAHGRQISFLDHNALEEIFIVSQAISGATDYKEKSTHRRGLRGNSVCLFMMPRKEKSAGEEYDLFSARKWVKRTIKKFIQGRFGFRDDRIVRDDLLAEAAIAVEQYAKTQESLDCVSEKQIFVAELIKRGKFSIAYDVLQACRIVSPRLDIHPAVIEAIHYLLVAAFEEAKDHQTHDGVACTALRDFNDSVLSHDIGLTPLKLLSQLKIFSESLPASIEVTKVLMRIMPALRDPSVRLVFEDLQILKHHLSNQNLSWMGHKIFPQSPPAIEEPAKKLILEYLAAILNHAEPLHLFQLNRSDRFADFLRAVYRAPAIYDHISEIGLEVLRYPKIQWAMQNGTLLEKEYADMPSTDKAYARDKFMSCLEKTTTYQEQTVNINYVKYRFALDLQNKIKQYKAIVLHDPEKISEFFSNIIQLLQQIQQSLLNAGETKDFYGRISSALQQVITAEQQWCLEMSMTIDCFSLPPERTEVTSAVAIESFDRF